MPPLLHQILIWNSSSKYADMDLKHFSKIISTRVRSIQFVGSGRKNSCTQRILATQRSTENASKAKCSSSSVSIKHTGASRKGSKYSLFCPVAKLALLPSPICLGIQSAMATETPHRVSPFAGLGPLILGIFTGIAVLALFAHIARDGVWDQVASIVTGRARHVGASLPTVVSQVQRLQRLETVTYTMDRIVEGDRPNTLLPDFLTGDRLLLVVHGEAIAGIDLSTLKPENVTVRRRDVSIRLPDPQLFVTRLDSGRTRVYSRNTGLFVSADPDLETQVRAKAEEQLREAALGGGILSTARQNARATVTSMLFGLGFERVQVD
jgi:Protein of unknown function (DUF4230)